MNLIIDCNISLSKKLRAIVGDEITLVLKNINDGKGQGMLITNNSTNIKDAESLLGSETSIMLTPTSVSVESPSYDAVPNLFSDQSNYLDDLDKKINKNIKPKKEFRNILETTPSSKDERVNHFGNKNEIPEAFEELKDPELQKHISNVQELWEEIEWAKNNKVSSINPDEIQNERKRLEAIEIMNIEEGLGKRAYVVNDTSGAISLSDINLTFEKNVPVDLSRFSAKTLYASNDLRVLLREKLLKVIPPEERDRYLKEKGEAQSFGLDTFGNIDEAMDNIGKKSSRKEQRVGEFDDYEMDIGIDDDYQTEAQSFVKEMSRQVPSISSSTLSGGVRKSSFGNSQNSSRQPQNSSNNQENRLDSKDTVKFAQKTIRKKY